MRGLPFYCVVIVAMILPAQLLQAQVTSNVLTRVLMIRAGSMTGTGFTLDVDGRQYLITAKHVVEKLKPEDSIEVFESDHWSPVKVMVFRCDDPIDIAVLITPQPLTPALPIHPTTDRLLFGQDAYFIGFPFGLSMSGNNLNGLYPFALIKKGTISAIVNEKGISVILLDGNNNPGFSGGPIVYRDLNQPNTVFYLAGVVSGFRHEFVPILELEVIRPDQDLSHLEPWRIVKKDGQRSVLKDTGLLAKLNTGIVRGYHINYAVDLIHKNPIGPYITK